MTDDLVKRLRMDANEFDCETYSEAADRIEELEQLFDLRWAADMRAIKAWQSAHPDQPRTWPDHADLGTWCLSRIEKLEAALREIIVHCEVPAPPNAEALIMFARKALEGKDAE